MDNRYIYNSGLWTVKVEKGYLALRNKPAYNDSNEIGQLNTGDTVQVKDTSDSNYWYVYSPLLDKTGMWTKTIHRWFRSYVSDNDRPGGKGYLALRNAKAYDKNNEIAAVKYRRSGGDH